MMVNAWKEPPAGEAIQVRISIAAADIHSSGNATGSVPLDRNAMGRVFGRQTHPRRQMSGPNAAQANEANPSQGIAMYDLRSKRLRDELCDRIRIDPVIHQDSPV